jgi:MFS family permease
VNGQFGWTYFILAFFCLITNGLAVKFGKRPLFLAANILLLATSIGSIYAKSWNMLLAFRLIGSLALAPYETLVSATVSDLYEP